MQKNPSSSQESIVNGVASERRSLVPDAGYRLKMALFPDPVVQVRLAAHQQAERQRAEARLAAAQLPPAPEVVPTAVVPEQAAVSRQPETLTDQATRIRAAQSSIAAAHEAQPEVIQLFPQTNEDNYGITA
ncbi:MAG: hypothetical protein JWN38_1054 [Candidatus Saccharibacteria bacterium]|nr:hypothetical protein [Candidatus Saccharibacteria bacterium]